MKKIFLFILLFSLIASARNFYFYQVIASVNDEKFILEDRYGSKVLVEAKTYCFWVDEDDVVFSTEDLDTCTSSIIINSSTHETCEVWCE